MKMTYRGFTTEPILDLDKQSVHGTAEKLEERHNSIEWEYCPGRYLRHEFDPHADATTAFQRAVDGWYASQEEPAMKQASEVRS